MADTATTSRLSRGMQALWGVAAPGRRGPKRAMSVHDIAATGIALADREGIDAVTMASVARELGYTTMSLYRYVDSRQDLLDVMCDEAYGEPPTSSGRAGWRRRLRAWAQADAHQLLAHTWVLSVNADSPPVGPNLTAWMEAGFSTLEATGLTPQQRASTLLTVDGYVRSNVQLSVRFASGNATKDWAPALREVVDPDRFPATHAIVASGAFEDGDDDLATDEFEFGLDLLLDGIAGLVDRSASPGG